MCVCLLSNNVKQSSLFNNNSKIDNVIDLDEASVYFEPYFVFSSRDVIFTNQVQFSYTESNQSQRRAFNDCTIKCLGLTIFKMRERTLFVKKMSMSLYYIMYFSLLLLSLSHVSICLCICSSYPS